MTKIAVLTPISKGGPYIWGTHLVNELRKNGYEAEHVCTLKNLLKSMFITDADIIHTTVPLWFRLYSKPVILTVKGDYRIEKAIWRPFYPLAIKFATLRTCSTKYLKHKLGLKNARVIPNAVDVTRFNKFKKHRPTKEVSIVTMTKFHFHDKAEGVIHLARIISTLDYPVTWTIIGGGQHLGEYKKRVKSIFKDARFLGFIDNPEEELPKYDIFAYWSKHDTFATAVIEAMACGLPIVTNDYGPTSEIIRHDKDGYISNEYGEYAKYLMDLCTNWRKRMYVGRYARKRICVNYSWENVAKQYIKLYENLK